LVRAAAIDAGVRIGFIENTSHTGVQIDTSVQVIKRPEETVPQIVLVIQGVWRERQTEQTLW
jgi:hypothetical protein